MRILLLLFLLLSWCGPAAALAVPQPGGDTAYSEEISWHEGPVAKRAWLARDELALFPKRRDLKPDARRALAQGMLAGATILEDTPLWIALKLPDPLSGLEISSRLRSLRRNDALRNACPVYYGSRLKDAPSRLIPTGQIIVRYREEISEASRRSLEKRHGLLAAQSFAFAPQAYLYQVQDFESLFRTANELAAAPEVRYAYPNWLRKRTVRAFPDDPLFEEQWHLNNTGQSGGTPGEDVRIVPAWDLYQGSSSEVIAVVDDGLEVAHEDLSPNMVSGMSWDYLEGDSDPTGGDHGTSVAGVAAARGFNLLGVSGAAPMARLIGHRLLGAETDANEADALSRNLDLIDIYSNSWGPFDDGARLEGPGPLARDAFENGVRSGRSGLGSIFVWAGGNGYDEDNSNYDGYANSRFTIAVAASTNTGTRADYSEKGANILVNAPSNGGTLGITTTDRTGALGFAAGNYTDNFGGTSSAAPLAAGVIALMLQANPGLSWRDVQHILVETAHRNDPEDAGWQVNGAGYAVSHKYGFGRINALAAVEAAKGWSTVEPETFVEAASSPHVPIPDNDPLGVSDGIAIERDLRVEFVEITFTAADHSYWGDLEIVLRSPSGTESILAETHNGGRSHTYNQWRFGSVRHFGESSLGTWTLTVRDLWAEDRGTFQKWALRIYGTLKSEPPQPPQAVTGGAIAVTGRSATLLGSVHAQGVPAMYYFQYGQTTAYGLQTQPAEAGSAPSPVEVSAPVTDLTPGRTYHYRLVASNALGTGYGEDRVFTTATPHGTPLPWLKPLLLDP